MPNALPAMTRATARVLAASVRSANSGLAFQWPANLRFHASIWAKVRPSGEGCRTGFTSTKRPYETAATTVAARMARATASPPSRDALPLLAVWLTYWLALFPGLISLDSVNQWGQIVTGRYDDWHPVFHTWVLWLLSRPGHSLGTVSLVQVVLTAVLLGHALSAARQLGVPGWLIWTAVAWFVLSPVFGVGTIAVWKDNAFGLTTLWTVVLLLRAVRRWTMTSASSLWFGIALALMSLFRHNGHLVAIPTLGVAAWGFRPRRRTRSSSDSCVATTARPDCSPCSATARSRRTRRSSPWP